LVLVKRRSGVRIPVPALGKVQVDGGISDPRPAALHFGNKRYIATKILPPTVSVQVRKFTVEALDRFYVELHKRGGVGGRPLAGATVHKVHFILRAALGLAVKWGWIPHNPTELATVPRFVRQDVDPPTPKDATRFWRPRGGTIRRTHP
jgi:hypothetical protein